MPTFPDVVPPLLRRRVRDAAALVAAAGLGAALGGAVARRWAEERERAAEELLDAVGHTVAAVALQADVAAGLVPTHPERAAEALRRIAEVSAATRHEVDAALGPLRPGAGGPVASRPRAMAPRRVRPGR